LRAVPDPDWLSGSDAARPRGHAPRVWILRASRAREGLTTVVTTSTAVRAARTGSRAGGRPTTLKSLATYTPPRVLTNADLEKMIETSDEWIMKRVGIRERHIAGPGVATSDLGKEAAVLA